MPGSSAPPRRTRVRPGPEGSVPRPHRSYPGGPPLSRPRPREAVAPLSSAHLNCVSLPVSGRGVPERSRSVS